MKFRTKYDDPSDNIVFWTDPGADEDLVQHSMQAECDINTIMARYSSTGDLTHVKESAAEYGDFYDVSDYKTGQDRLIAVQALFMELPATLRDKLNNDPAQFIEYATDEKNIEELRSLGLAEPLPPTPVAPITRKDLEEVLDPKGPAKPTPKGETS
ncbi:internal scaffolding protein [Blackfly microvirus SF02]|uniref:Internal scaffolding protein n=1 Tax=Blackfly microvirus SF02 TaxID=2576452 RepID=A0A4P8PQC2_9VIRU|nr:internal scaffolding protein [Blackfly microvirus SF02]